MSYPSRLSPALNEATSAHCNGFGPDQFSALTHSEEKIDLVTWLEMVQYHSKTGSIEDQKSLIGLASNLPDATFATAEVRNVIEKIKTFMSSRDQYDKTLSPTSLRALRSLIIELSPNEYRARPSCARRLNFSGDDFK